MTINILNAQLYNLIENRNSASKLIKSKYNSTNY